VTRADRDRSPGNGSKARAETARRRSARLFAVPRSEVEDVIDSRHMGAVSVLLPPQPRKRFRERSVERSRERSPERSSPVDSTSHETASETRGRGKRLLVGLTSLEARRSDLAEEVSESQPSVSDPAELVEDIEPGPKRWSAPRAQGRDAGRRG